MYFDSNCLLLFTGFLITVIKAEIQNACKSYAGYSARLNCFHNPDVDSYTDEITKNHNYPSETYEVTTPDGYILTLFRIPNNSSTSQTIYIQHGAATDSTVWVDIGERSLAFYLYNLGYDVWMGNIRGSYYSRDHVNKTIGAAFWDFSLDELALHDIPTLLNFVSSNTKHKNNKKIVYIGHSMGTTLSYLYSIVHKEAAENTVCGFINLAPVTYFDHTIIGSLYTKPLFDTLQLILGVSGYPIAADRGLNQEIYNRLCLYSTPGAVACNAVLNLGFGANPPQRLPEDLPLILSYVSSGISSKILSHFLQFRMEKFNHFKNGILEPEEYDIKAINNRFLLLYGPNDVLSNVGDVNNFRKKLSDPGMFEVESIDSFEHLDFMYAKDIIALLYERMIPFIERLERQNCQ